MLNNGLHNNSTYLKYIYSVLMINSLCAIILATSASAGNFYLCGEFGIYLPQSKNNEVEIQNGWNVTVGGGYAFKDYAAELDIGFTDSSKLKGSKIRPSVYGDIYPDLTIFFIQPCLKFQPSGIPIYFKIGPRFYYIYSELMTLPGDYETYSDHPIGAFASVGLGSHNYGIEIKYFKVTAKLRQVDIPCDGFTVTISYLYDFNR
jgi:hypothetical protein